MTLSEQDNTCNNLSKSFYFDKPVLFTFSWLFNTLLQLKSAFPKQNGDMLPGQQSPVFDQDQLVL